MSYRFVFVAACALTFVAMTTPLFSQSPSRAVYLRCESMQNPLGIDSARPELAWQMQDERQNARQTAYEILVGSSAENVEHEKGDIWDSGKVISARSIHIPYAGPALVSRRRYYWTVKIWDADGQPSSSSETGWWEMGLLEKSDWQARWIARPDPEQAADRAAGVKWIWLPGTNPETHVAPGPRYFRYSLSLSQLPETATLSISGKDSMEASVNGSEVGSSSTWGTFEVLDILPRLKTGPNLISVIVTTSGTGGMAALLKLTEPDGTIRRIPSDDHWQISSSPEGGFGAAAVIADLGAQPIADPWPPQPASYFRQTFRVEKKIERARLYSTSLGAYLTFLNGKRVGEDILTPGWTDYDKRIQYQTYDVTDLVKEGANAIGAIVGDGWYASGLGWKLQRYLFGPPPNRLFLQLELTFSDGSTDTIATDKTWRTSTGAIRDQEIYAGETQDGRLIVPFDQPDFSDGSWHAAQLEPAAASAALVAQRDPAIQVAETRSPKTVTSPAPGVTVFDFGQNVAGWARLKVRGPSGTTVRLRFAEILKPDGNIYTQNLRSAKATDTFILSGKGDEVFEPRFTYHGFRYVELTGYPGKPTEDSVKAVVLHSALGETGRFETSSELVNQLWHNILWGQRDNLMSIPTDCPQRDERLGWMADAQIFWRTASYNMDMDAFTTKWMRDVRDAQAPNGAFSDVSPRVIDMADGAPAWGDAGVIVPWITWQQYGDLRVVSENWEPMKKWLAYIQAVNPDFLWENRRNNDFGDWVPANSTTPKDLIATAFWAYDSQLMSQMATALGKSSEAAEYQGLFAKIKAAFIAKFVQADGTVGNGSQTCDLLALHMNLLPDNLRAKVADHLVADIQARDWHLSTGFVGTAFLMPALSANGKNDVAYRLLLNDTYPSWGYMIRKGATTMWERWNGDTGDPAMNSYNHYAFGAVGEWLYETVGGIRPDPSAPGFQKIIIHPQPDGRLTHAYAEYDSPYGKISTAWAMGQGKPFSLKVTIPPNTTASVYLPDSRVVEIGSGTYQYEVK